jgi:hypothetical protein
MFKLIFGLFSKLGPLILAGYIFWLAWANLGPRKAEVGPLRKELADTAVSKIVEDIRLNRGDLRDVVLLHFANDPSDYFTDRLRSVIEQRGTLDLRDMTLSEKLWRQLGFRISAPASNREAIEVGRAADAQGVLLGSLAVFESTPGGASMDVTYHIGDVKTGKVAYTGRFQDGASDTDVSLANVKEAVQKFPWFQRGLAWLVLVLLLPVFTIVFIRTMVRQRSNRRNAFILAIYTVVDALLAWLLVGAALASWWSVLIFIVAVVAAFLYNIRIMTFAINLEAETS